MQGHLIPMKNKASMDINNDQLESLKVKKRQPPRRAPDFLMLTSESTSTPTAPRMSLMRVAMKGGRNIE